jgi:hypothetical protein
MNIAITVSQIERNPQLLRQTVVVIGRSAGIVLKTAPKGKRGGSESDSHRLRSRSPAARSERGPSAEFSSGFDATDLALLEQFFCYRPTPIHHIMV